ncbi:MAG: outer membrane protein transport protein [Azonexus sp.]
MQHHITPRLIPALLAIAFSGAASASGFAIMEQNASGMGNAYAGSAAVAENASTIWYNPAGMTKLQDREFSLGGSIIRTSFDFNNDGSLTGAFSNTGDGGDGGGYSLVPNAYLSWRVAPDWYVGIGMGAPFGNVVEYNTPWIGSAHSTSFDIKTINLNPSVAWRANEWLSLGAGVSWQRMEATYESALGIGGRTPAQTAAIISSSKKLDVSDDSWNWNIGALFTVAPQTKIGIAYRSTTDYTLSGDISGSGPLAALVNSDAKTDLKLPDSFILSIAQGFGDRWEVLGDVSWMGWSSVQQLDIIRTSGPASGSVAQVLETKFNDTWRFALGANYKMRDDIKLRVGVAYDNTPVPNAEYRVTSLPDNDRTWLTGGVQWKPTKTSALDLGAAYIWVKDAPINNAGWAGASIPQGLVKGDYSDYSWLLGAQYSMGF